MENQNQNNNKLNINDYIIVDNEYVGKVIKLIWNSNGYIIELLNCPNYIDKTILQYKLLDTNDDINNINGYMIITFSQQIEKINLDKITELINEKKQNQQLFKLVKDLEDLKILHGQQTKSIININSSIKTTEEIINDNINANIYKTNKYSLYNEQTGMEDNYPLYISQMISNLFVGETKVKWEEKFQTAMFASNSNSTYALGEENINTIIKPALISLLEKFDPIDMEQYYDFTKTVAYKHLIYDENIDTISIGKELIGMIKKTLLKFQSKLELDDGTKLLDSTNLFDWIDFKIVGGYIEISNLNFESNSTSTSASTSTRTITPELVPNLTQLVDQYAKPIDYDVLTTIILQNKIPNDVIINKTMIEEALKILSQEYIICFQPKVELLLWVIIRLIICWYADPKLFENICKIRILINLFRARGIKEFNKDQGIQPIIMIIPSYGKKNTIKVLSHLSYFFFPYKKIGWKESNPTWFESLDNLMSYTNGSLELKKYVRFLLGIGEKNNTYPITNDMTKIDGMGLDNQIEYVVT